MNDSMDLILYESLRKRIINNEELSDKEWDLFFYIEEKTKGIRIQNNEWSKIFSAYPSETYLKPEEKQELEELKEEYLLQNANIIKDNSKEKFTAKSREPLKKSFAYSFFSNKQMVFAITTGFVVVLFTSLFLLSNRNVLYTGDLLEKGKIANNSSFNTPNDIILKEKNDGNLPGKYNDLAKVESDNETVSKSIPSDANITAVNSYLEESISTDFRSNDDFIKIIQPVPSAEFENKNLKNIVFKGELFSKSGKITTITMKIFDNIEKSYIDDKPIVKKEIPLEKTASSQKVFDIGISSSFKPGLYYYIFEDTDGNLLHAGKFFVKN